MYFQYHGASSIIKCSATGCQGLSTCLVVVSAIHNPEYEKDPNLRFEVCLSHFSDPAAMAEIHHLNRLLGDPTDYAATRTDAPAFSIKMARGGSGRQQGPRLTEDEVAGSTKTTRKKAEKQRAGRSQKSTFGNRKKDEPQRPIESNNSTVTLKQFSKEDKTAGE